MPIHHALAAREGTGGCGRLSVCVAVASMGVKVVNDKASHCILSSHGKLIPFGSNLSTQFFLLGTNLKYLGKVGSICLLRFFYYVLT